METPAKSNTEAWVCLNPLTDMTGIFSVEDSGIKLFTDKISLINKMYNEPIRLIFDEKNIYLLQQAKAV